MANSENETPKPRSDEALDQGCACPVIDNGHGKGVQGRGFVSNAECPLHGVKAFLRDLFKQGGPGA